MILFSFLKLIFLQVKNLKKFRPDSCCRFSSKPSMYYIHRTWAAETNNTNGKVVSSGEIFLAPLFIFNIVDIVTLLWNIRNSQRSHSAPHSASHQHSAPQWLPPPTHPSNSYDTYLGLWLNCYWCCTFFAYCYKTVVQCKLLCKCIL